MKKKRYIFLGLVLFVVALAIVAAQYVAEVTAVAENTGEMPDFKTVLMDKLLPEAMRIVTEVGTVLALLWPSIGGMTGNVLAAASAFKNATATLNEVRANFAEVKKELAARKQSEEALLIKSDALQVQVVALTQAVALLACGNDALVANGTARKIMEAFEHAENA